MPLVSAGVVHGEFDVCVVGAGPAGLACAFDCHDLGLRVLVLEAGGRNPIPGKPDLLAAEIVEPACHDPVEIVAASALGGSSHWWGGLCLPLDPSDMASWPISHDDLAPWWARAADFLGSLSDQVLPPAGAFGRLRSFEATRAESWPQETRIAQRLRGRISAADGPAILLGARVTGLEVANGRIGGVRVLVGGGTRVVRPAHTVLAGGGLGGLRLLLLTQRDHPGLCGGPDGALGRSYMGHLTGSIADLLPADPNDVDAFRRVQVGDRLTRRRIQPTAATIDRHALGNIGFWLDNPASADPSHGSSVASAKYLAARMVRKFSRGVGIGEAPLGPHLANVARAPVSAAAGLTHALTLLAMTRMTGRRAQARPLHPAAGGGWRLDYHAEQFPDPANRVSLSADQVDSVGLPRLHINFCYSERDCLSVVRAHQLLNEDLIASGAGRLRMKGSEAELTARVTEAARDGYHQIGGAIMSRSPEDGVVDANARVHGLENLWIASSSIFPTGGQANPTLTIVALARRLAAHIAGLRSSKGVEQRAGLETA